MGNTQEAVYHETEFTLSEIPAQPKINIQFKVISAGSCPNSYDPTTLTVNDKHFASLDFRDFELDEAKNLLLDVPPKYLRTGRNILTIITGECDWGVDSLDLNKMSLM